MRSILLVLIFAICSLGTRAQGTQGETYLSFEFQRGNYSGLPYAQGMLYLDYYLFDKWKLSWGIGTGLRENMRYQHIHIPLGPVLAYRLARDGDLSESGIGGALLALGLLTILPEKIQRDFVLKNDLVIQPFIRVFGGHIASPGPGAATRAYWNPGFGWNLYKTIGKSKHKLGVSTEYQSLMGGSGLFFGANLNFRIN